MSDLIHCRRCERETRTTRGVCAECWTPRNATVPSVFARAQATRRPTGPGSWLPDVVPDWLWWCLAASVVGAVVSALLR
jgi:ribosomal protein L37E